MFESIKISVVLFLFYIPFFFLVLIPSNSIFLRPHDLHEEVCLKLSLPFLCEPPSMTLAIIKPDGMLYEEQIMEIIQEKGFKVLQDKTIKKLSSETISEWYFDKHEESYYPSLIEYLQRGPVRVLSLSRMNAISTLRTLIGPTNPNLARQLFPKSIRAFYGTNIQENSIHASDSVASAEREYKLFF